MIRNHYAPGLPDPETAVVLPPELAEPGKLVRLPDDHVYRICKTGRDVQGWRWAVAVRADADPGDTVTIGGVTMPRSLTHLRVAGPRLTGGAR